MSNPDIKNRRTSTFSIHTVRTKLLLSFTSFLLLTCLMILTIFWFDLKEERIEKIFTILSQLNLKVKEVSKMEKDFFSYESINPNFYRTKESRFLNQRNILIRDINGLLTSLQHIEEVSPMHIDVKITLISDKINKFEKRFDSLVHLIHQRGFKDFGIEGEMRHHIHFIEGHASSHNLVIQNKILMIRRSEKDFIIRKQYNYVQNIDKQIEDLRQYIRTYINTKEERDIFLQHLNDYQKKFHEIVRIEQFVGFHNHSGLKNQLIILTNDIEKLIKELNTKVFNRAEEISSQIRIILIFVMLVGITLNVVLGYFVTQHLGRPIVQLSTSIREIIKSDFAPDRKIANITTKDEIGVLSNDLRKMMHKIKANTQQIKKQNAMISEAYENVKLLSQIGQEITAYLNIRIITLRLYEHLQRLMYAESFGIGVYHAEKRTLDFEIFIQNGKEMPGSSMQIDEKNRLATWCFRNEKQVFINNFDQEYRNYIQQDIGTIHGGQKTQSMIYLPLISKEKIIGVLTIQSFQKNAYSEYQLNILQNLATFIAIALENSRAYKQIETQKNIIAQKNKDVTDSINYAYRIQHVMLPPLTEIEQHLSEVFIFYKPRDIVSGDFYWFGTLEEENKCILVAADCTGHGVPGALMSIIGKHALEDIIRVKNVSSPNEILNQLDTEIQKTLRHNTTDMNDGMDICICKIDKSKRTLEYAGAKNPLVCVQSKEGKHTVKAVKANRRSIGGWGSNHYYAYEEYQKHTLPLEDCQNTTFFIFSDGYQDQFGGALHKKFMRRRLHELFTEIHQRPLKNGKKIAQNTLTKWMNTTPFHQANEQIDDILLIGFRI